MLLWWWATEDEVQHLVAPAAAARTVRYARCGRRLASTVVLCAEPDGEFCCLTCIQRPEEALREATR